MEKFSNSKTDELNKALHSTGDRMLADDFKHLQTSSSLWSELEVSQKQAICNNVGLIFIETKPGPHKLSVSHTTCNITNQLELENIWSNARELVENVTYSWAKNRAKCICCFLLGQSIHIEYIGCFKV